MLADSTAPLLTPVRGATNNLVTARCHRTPAPDHRVGAIGKLEAITPEGGRNYAKVQSKESPHTEIRARQTKLF